MSKSWCFTICNWTDADIRYVMDMDVSKIRCAREICPSTGTPHLQGEVTFKRKYTIKALKKNHPTARWDAKKSCDFQYVAKREADWVRNELGNQGARLDLDAARAAPTMGHLLNIATNPQAYRMKQIMLTYAEEPREVKPLHVVWVKGERRATKRWVYEISKGSVYQPMGKWWEGYDADPIIFLADIKAASDYDELLSYCEGFPLRVPSKGGSRQALWDTVFLSSEWWPHDVWSQPQKPFRAVALVQLITEVWHVEVRADGQLRATKTHLL